MSCCLYCFRFFVCKYTNNYFNVKINISSKIWFYENTFCSKNKYKNIANIYCIHKLAEYFVII